MVQFHSQAVPTIAQLLITAGIQQAQGFFTNVSNYNLNNYETTYETWVSDGIAFGRKSRGGRLAAG